MGLRNVWTVLLLVLAELRCMGLAFQPRSHIITHTALRSCRWTSARSVRSPRPLFSSTDDEIAALEEKLAELKRTAEADAEAEAEKPEAGEVVAAAEPPPAPRGFEVGTLSNRGKVANMREAPPSEFVSEAWKDVEPEEGAGLLPVILGAFLAVGFLAASQVPVGNEVPVGIPANDGSAGKVMTPEEIRARYSTMTVE